MFLYLHRCVLNTESIAKPQPAKGLFDSLTKYLMNQDDEDETGKTEVFTQDRPPTEIHPKEGTCLLGLGSCN